MRKNKYERNMIAVFAFRYALGRRSAAPSIMSDYLIEHINMFEDWEKDQIVEEIAFAIRTKNAGEACDVEDWAKVVEVFKGSMGMSAN
jgi:hypothetical protein